MSSAPSTSPWRTSRWWATTVLVALGVVACLGLGAWQYDRARTRDTPSGPSDPMSAPAVPLAQAVPTDGRVPAGSDPRSVTVSGTYDDEHQLLVPGREQAGSPVAWVVTPMLRDGAAAVLVVRGVVPDGAAPPPAPTGDVTLTGWLAPSEPLDVSAVDALALPSGQVATVTAARVLSQVPYPLVDGFVGLVEQSGASGAHEDALSPLDVPRVQPGVRWSVQSLAYAIEWWFFALAGAWMWVQALRIERRRSEGGTAAAGQATVEAPAPPSG